MKYRSAPQVYSHPTDGARALGEDGRQSIRIGIHYVEDHMTGITPEQTAFIKDVLVPQAVDWLSQAVSVHPADEPLTIPRFCTSVWLSAPTSGMEKPSTCKSVEDTPTCSGVEIPAEFFTEQEMCTAMSTDGPQTCVGHS